jgi:hypothetical protein
MRSRCADLPPEDRRALSVSSGIAPPKVGRILRRMTREYVEMAIEEGVPFEINMADGKSCRVNDESSIALIGNTAVIVVEDALPRILPLLTVTGISCLKMPHQKHH